MTRRSYGTGSLHEAKPGVWRLRVYVGTNPLTGRPMQLNRTVHTKPRGGRSEAQEALAAFVAEVKDAGAHPGTNASFGVLLDEWLVHLEHQGKAPSTMTTYRNHAENHIRPTLGKLKVKDLNAHMLDRFYRNLVDGGLGVLTVRLIHAICSAALSQAVDWGWVKTSAAAGASPPKDTRDHDEVLTSEQVLALIAGANENEDDELSIAIALAAFTGARRGELCGLMWSDVDWVAGTIRIERSRVPVQGQGIVTGKTKTGKGRTVWVGPELVDRLKWYRVVTAARSDEDTPADGWLLTLDNGTTPYSPKVLTTRLTALGKKLKIPVKTHALRHYAVTQAVSGGVDPTTASSMFGHSVGTMLGTYSHPVVERHQEAAAMLSRVLAPPKETQ